MVPDLVLFKEGKFTALEVNFQEATAVNSVIRSSMFRVEVVPSGVFRLPEDRWIASWWLVAIFC
jgi:hypothetical protein